jgi:DNA-binding transcriptional ArsR family regulator
VVLVPSFFCPPTPVLVPRHEQAPLLIHPVLPDLLHGGGPAVVTDRPQALSLLLGRTRADVLLALDQEGSTTELADRVGVSLPSISQHATVLREAGLISSRRVGPRVVHCRTALGERLVGRREAA